MPPPETQGPLRRLGLDDSQLAALARQGAVVSELRGAKTVYKLRFRHEGRLRTKCLGADPVQAERMRLELVELQSGRRSKRRLQLVAGQARRGLRSINAALVAPLAEAGYAFHGHALRRTRAKTPGK